MTETPKPPVAAMMLAFGYGCLVSPAYADECDAKTVRVIQATGAVFERRIEGNLHLKHPLTTQLTVACAIVEGGKPIIVALEYAKSKNGRLLDSSLILRKRSTHLHACHLKKDRCPVYFYRTDR